MDFWRSELPTYMYIKLFGMPKGFGRICMFNKRYIIFTSVLIVLLVIICNIKVMLLAIIC